MDIFATNRPTLINKCISVPGISDHDAVYIESYITAKYKKPAKRKIYLWDKTDFNLLTQVLSEFVSGFIAENTTSSSVQQMYMWDDFKTKCIDCLELVPYKYSSTRFSSLGLPLTLKEYVGKRKGHITKPAPLDQRLTGIIIKNLKKQHNVNAAKPIMIMFPDYLILAPTARSSGPSSKGVVKIIQE